MRYEDLQPYTLNLLRLHGLREAGYQIANDDLSIEEWLDLGRIDKAFKPQFICPLMSTKT